MNIKLPNDFKNIICSPEYVEVKLSSYWRKNKKDVCDWIGPELQAQKLKYELYSENGCRVFSTDLDNAPRGKGKFKSQLRFNLGYGAMSAFSDKQLGFKIYSERAFDFINNDLTNNEITDDHFFGSTPTGTSVFRAYRDSNWDLDYVLHDYIPNGLYKFLTVKILDIGEHTAGPDGAGVARGDKNFSLEEKVQGLHYKKANIGLPLIVTNSKNERLV